MNKRDFIYLDVERIRSLFSQLESGVIEETTAERRTEQTLKGGVEGGIPLIGKGQGSAASLYYNGQTETRILHDHMFNLVEEKLVDESFLVDVNSEIQNNRWNREKVNEIISPTSFIKIRGKVRLLDFSRLTVLMKDFNLVYECICTCAMQQELDGLNKSKRRHEIKKRVEECTMAPEVITSMTELMSRFYGDSIVLHIWPVDEVINCLFSCRIDKNFLRDSIDNIGFKFGVRPEHEWVLVAQIARIPNRISDSVAPPRSESSHEMDAAMVNMFESAAEIFKIAEVKYPEISVTPLGIYRE